MPRKSPSFVSLSFLSPSLYPISFSSLFPFFFSFSPPSTEFPLSWFVPILFPFSHFLIFLPFLFSFIFSFLSFFFSFLLYLYLILIHPPNLSTSGGNFPPLSSMPLVILIFFLTFLIFLYFPFFLYPIFDTWLIVSHSYKCTTWHIPCVTPLGCMWNPHDHAMCHLTPGTSKNVKFRLSRNPMKFNGVTRFRETNSTVKSVLSPEIYKIFGFQPKLPFYIFFKKIEFFPGFTFSPP